MIAYEIQLRYVIRDKIQSETNSVWDKFQSETDSVWDKIQSKQIQSKTKFSPKNISFPTIGKKILTLNFVSDCILSQTEFVSDFQCTFLSCLGPFNAYHH